MGSIVPLNETLLECNHEAMEIRYVLAKNKKKMFALQCLVCGEMVSSWLKTKTIDAEDKDKIKPFDEDLREEQFKLRSIQRRKAYDKAREKRKEFYDLYLASSDWQEKRKLVLRRCGGFCERCGVVPMYAVHHLSYKNLGHEELSELLGVCEHCHAKLHGRV